MNLKRNNSCGHVLCLLGVALINGWIGTQPLIAVQDSNVSKSTAKGKAQLNEPSSGVKFSQHVLPILSNKCFRCHGPDENTREAGLRLDVREEAIEFGAIAPNDVDSSEIITRVESNEKDELMPPVASGVEALTEAEIAILKKWIDEGAGWQTHWAFVPPQSTSLPIVNDKNWIQNPIDNFVLARLEKSGLRPSVPADKATLIRRTSLLITGLPPTQKQFREFQADTSPDAFEKVVDRLLESEAFGERMANAWMDIARYSDTDGFQGDDPRTNWPWRDWAVDAYNSNMPFDQFTIEQFAGDLLPDATDKQVLATCFHRNHMTNGEGGRDPEESRVDYVLDRVNTMGTAWLGLTLGCAQCHSHKYDPITQKEYYQLSAFFNSIDEDGRAGNKAKPYLNWKLKEADLLLRRPLELVRQRELELDKKRKAALEEANIQINEGRQVQAKTLDRTHQTSWNILEVQRISATDKAVVFESENDGIWRVKKGNPNNETYTVLGDSANQEIGTLRLETLPHKTLTKGGLARSNSGNFVLTDFVVHVVRQSDQRNESEAERIRLHFDSAWADYEQPGFPVVNAIDPILDTGWAVWSGQMNRPRTALFHLRESITLKPDDQLEIKLVHFSHHAGHNIGRFRLSVCSDVDAVHTTKAIEILTEARDQPLTKNQREDLQKYYVDHNGEVGLAAAQLKRARNELERQRSKSTLPVMVMKERESKRNTYVLQRGIWDAHGEQVFSGTPKALQQQVEPNALNNRLHLARWLVNRRNPLTARVTVNRYWQMYFGAGLVRTPEDFGLQGQHPTHPGLLDWLAVEFMEHRWDIKKIHKLIVMSATFQQSSVATQQLLELDSENRLLARGPRFRMPAYMIRDNALAVSGLLSPQIGGPPVKPYQPKNVWAASDQGKYPYIQARGENLYRRSLYTYWRRNIAPPGMFDAAQRRVCEVGVRRTNSPMHALTLLSDTTYVEAARILAQRALHESNDDDKQLINWLYRQVLVRDATALESNRLTKSFQAYQQHYEANPMLAEELLRQGEKPTDQNLLSARLAALTIVASTLLNLDETLNIE